MANQYNAIFNAIVRADAGQAVTELRRVDGQVERTTGTATSKFSQFGVLAKGAVAGIGAAAVVSLGRDAVNAASDLEESINAVKVVFGEAASGVLDIGKNSATSFGLAQSEFNSLAVQFAGFATKVAGPTGDVAAVIEDLATRVADFASVMNLDLATAAQVFQSTLAGETEPIRKYGADVSAAAVEQFALETGLIRTKAELTESIKVQARYGLLMRETAKTAGDFANTSDSLANQQRILRAELENLSAKVGALIVPALSRLAGGFLGAYEDAKALFDFLNGVKLPGWLTGEETSGGGSGGFNPLGWVDDLFINTLPGGIKSYFEMWDEALTGGGAADRMEDFRDRLTFMLTPGNLDDMEWTARKAYDQVRDLEQAWIDNAAGMRRAVLVEAGRALVEHARDISDVNRKVRELEAAWVSYTNELLGIQSDSLSVQQAFADIEQAAVDAYNASIDGAEDAEQKQRDYQQSIIDAKTDVLGLLESLGNIPARTQAEILTLIDEQNYDLAMWKIAELTRDRELRIRFNLQSGALGSAGVSFNQALGAAIFGAPRGATGGIVTRPTMALIGEAGPEAVVPLNRTPGSSPLPKGGMGGVTNNIYVSAGVGDPVQIGRAVVDAINASYRAGGQRIAA